MMSKINTNRPITLGQKIRELINLKYNSISLSGMHVSWFKDISISTPTGHVIDDKILFRWPAKEVQKVQERRWLKLYSPWKIKTHYYYNDEDRRIVVNDPSGDERIETHEFVSHVTRKKLAWWDNYRIVDKFSNDMTEFDRELDHYLTGGMC